MFTLFLNNTSNIPSKIKRALTGNLTLVQRIISLLFYLYTYKVYIVHIRESNIMQQLRNNFFSTTHRIRNTHVLLRILMPVFLFLKEIGYFMHIFGTVKQTFMRFYGTSLEYMHYKRNCLEKFFRYIIYNIWSCSNYIYIYIYMYVYIYIYVIGKFHDDCRPNIRIFLMVLLARHKTLAIVCWKS